MSGIDFGSLIIVGVVVSLFVQAIKKHFWTQGAKMLLVVVVSLIAATIYYFFKDTSYWQVFLTILSFAGAVYTFIIEKLERD